MDRGRIGGGQGEDRGRDRNSKGFNFDCVPGKFLRERGQTNAQNVRIYEILPNEGPF